jgi:phospholipid/cholesterol/gamma-HCH transport system substrate-binding protein
MKLSREFKIGLIAVIAVALAIWGINYLKGINIFRSTNQYYAVYNNVKGLVENANVFLNGYKVGNVNKIEFDQNNVNRIIVRISLEENLTLRKNTILLLRSGSIISGSKDVDIIPGDGEGFYASGDTLPAMIQADLTDFVDPLRLKIESAVTAIDSVLYALSNFLDPATRKDLKGMIKGFDGAASSLNASLKPSGSLYASMSNLSELTGNLKESNEEISRILANFAAISDTLEQAELKKLISQAGETFAQTNELFTAINQGQGTAGQLMVNDSLYNNLNNALASLDSLLIDLREHPKRYVHLSVFGKKDK